MTRGEGGWLLRRTLTGHPPPVCLACPASVPPAPTPPRPARADHDDAVRPRTRRARGACVAAARLTPGGVETAHPLPVLLRAPGPHSIRPSRRRPSPRPVGFAASGGNATKQLAAVRGVGPRRVSSSRRRHRRDPRGLAPPWGTGMRRGSRQTQRPASEPPGPTVAADDAPTSCLGDNGTASLPWALSTATCSAQVRRPASRPSFPSFPTPSQPQRPTPRCRQICAGTTSSCSNFPGGSVHFRPFPLEKISPAPGNRIRR